MAETWPQFSLLIGCQGFGGILSSGLSVVLLAAGQGDSVGAATWYFLFAAVFLLATLLIYAALTRHALYQLHAGPGKEEVERSPGSALGHLAVVGRVWRPALCVFLVCLLNLSLYPALLRLAEPVHEAAAWATYFLPVGVFLAFNLLDFLGRLLASWLHWPPASEAGTTLCLAASVARFALVPLFLVCNLSPEDRHLTPVLIKSDTGGCQKLLKIHSFTFILSTIRHGVVGVSIVSDGTEPDLKHSPACMCQCSCCCTLSSPCLAATC